MPDQAGLKAEARVLGRFILGREPEAEFAERYAAAHSHLFKELIPPGDRAIVAFAMRMPLLVPCVDAAAARFRPGSLIHRKALLMAAILEASPRYADEFLPRTKGMAGLVWLVLWTGVVSAVQIVLGAPVLFIVGRRR
jgi:hypothetical protein